MTILFTDVRGFTAISESFKSDPQGLVSLMNGMLTPLSNAILDARGTIDKYMGDAILAFWNAPLDDSEHAGHACLAALDMHARLAHFNQQRQREAEAAGRTALPIRIGVGINTGACVVGNFGSDIRFDYSALGDSVNTASRIEALTATYGTDILVGESTAQQAAAQVATLPVDRIRVKGKEEPTTLHAVLGPKSIESAAWFQPLEAALARMFAAYAAADWAQARTHLAACRAVDVDARLSGVIALFETRIADLQARAIAPGGWDGVYAFASKSG